MASGSESTAIYYAYNLQNLLKKRKQTPKEFLDYCEKKITKPNGLGKLWIELRDQAYEFKPSQVKLVVKATKSFLRHHGIFLPTERLPTPKVAEHKELPYDDVKRIIVQCPEPYKTIFTIFSLAPMGESSFIHWNSKPDMAKDMQSQLFNKKPYVKIIHPPRKNAKRKFYSLIPKAVIQDYLDRGGELPFRNYQGNLIQDYNLQGEWRRIREGRAGFKLHKGVGCHEARDAWFTFAGSTAGGKVGWEYRKFAIGHSDFSEMEYNKLWENEAEVYSELRKSWEGKTVATKEELTVRDEQISQLQTQVKELSTRKRLSEDKIFSTMNRGLLMSSGYTKEELDKLGDLGKLTHEQVQRLFDQKKEKGEGEVERKAVSVRELNSLFKEGWKQEQELKNGKVVVVRKLGAVSL